MSVKNEVSICGQICRTCKEFKEWHEYTFTTRYPSGVVSECKECAHRRYIARKPKTCTHIDPPRYRDLDIANGGNLCGRVCSRCGEFKDWRDFPVDSRYGLGYGSQCKMCCRKIHKLKFPPKGVVGERNIIDGKQQCSSCGEIKPLEEYRTYSVNSGVLTVRKCKVCERKTYKLINESPVPYYRYKDKLDWCMSVRSNNNGELEVKCDYCGKWYAPTKNSIGPRIKGVNSITGGTYGLYCSTECAHKCPMYHKKKYVGSPPHIPKSRLDSNIIRKLAFANYPAECARCGKLSELEVHHEKSVKEFPMLEADIDNLWILCEECHDKAHHTYPSCTKGYLSTLKCNNSIKGE